MSISVDIPTLPSLIDSQRMDVTFIDPQKSLFTKVSKVTQSIWNLTQQMYRYRVIFPSIPLTTADRLQNVLQTKEAMLTEKPHPSNRVIPFNLRLVSGKILKCHRLETSFRKGGEKRAHLMVMTNSAQKIDFFVFLNTMFGKKINVCIEKQAIAAGISLPALFLDDSGMVVPLAKDGIATAEQAQTEQERLDLAFQYLDLCIRARKAGIYHCDLKLDNCLQKDGRLYLCDFGSSTQEKMICMKGRGTLTYLPFILSQKGYSRVTSSISTNLIDNHALGCTLYEILSGEYHTSTTPDLPLDTYHKHLRHKLKHHLPKKSRETTSSIAKRIYQLIPELCREGDTALPIEELEARVNAIKRSSAPD